MKVFSLGKKHVGDLVDLTRLQVEETINHLPYEESVVRRYCEKTIDKGEDSPTKAYLVYADNGIPAGYLIVNIQGYLFNNGCFISQEVIYVIPEYRGTKAALLLLQKLEEVAEEEYALEIFTGVANNFNVEKTGRLLEKRGYENVGRYYRKIL